MNATINCLSTRPHHRAPTQPVKGLIRYVFAVCAAVALSACVYGNNNDQISTPAEQPLQISTSGAGTVISDPNGISCGTQCTATYSTDTEVVLTAQASNGYTFASWSGSGLSCPGTGPCRVPMKTAHSVHASFNPHNSTATLSVSTTGGNGTVTSNPAGISCGTDCSQTVDTGTVVTLSAAPSTGYTFVGWSGSGINCTGTGGCNVTVNGATNVVATFSPVVATTYTLGITVTGSGTVTSSPAGISCPSACSKDFDAGTSVTLTAAATTGYTFTGWNATGISCGTATTCTVPMSAARSVSATFTQNAPTTYTLTVSQLGLGTVTSAPSGINCGSTCSASYAANTNVVLSATPSTGYQFIGWSGNGITCTGTGSCTVTMSAARTVTATFSAVTVTTYTLSVSKSGTGTVTSSPSGVSCGSTCSASYTAGTSVTITAAAGSGSTFSGWSGACSGSSTTCTVSMSQARSATATFTTSTSSGGGTSSGTPDWTRTETPTNWDYTSEVASRSACAANEGVTYEVGPGKTYTRAAQVPWLKLMPCDQVLFYYSSTPYTDIVFLGSRGEKNKWITIAGVAGPNGELPVFDGNGAIMPKGTGANSYSDSAGMIEVVVPDSSVVTRASLYKPGYLHFTGLKFQHAHPSYKVTNLSGTTTNWAEFSSGIYLVGTEHVVIDNCEFTGNGLGVFANSGGDQYMQTRGLTISHNYFHGNGISGKASEHNAYTEGIGTIYEYNYFGAPVTGTGGDNIKERSAGVIFRYNYIEDGVDLIALRDPESNADYEAAAVDAQGEPLVSKAFIYSNIFVARNPTIYSEAPIIVAHGDGPFGTGKQVRYGSVFFYSNRVISTLDKGTQLSATPLFDFLNTRAATTVVARNNLFYAVNKTSNGTAAPFALYYWQGKADWSDNWINKFQNVYASAADGGLAAGTKYDGSGLGGLTAQTGDPGFVSFSTSNFLTTTSSPFASLNGTLPTAVTVRGLAPAGNPVVTPFGR